MKRAFDILSSLLALILLSPVLVFTALWIKSDSPGPVLYAGYRTGRYGKLFRMLKFRTMVLHAEKNGSYFHGGGRSPADARGEETAAF